MINEKFLHPYDPTSTERRIYKKWLADGYFNPDNLPPRHDVPYSIVLPPPNVTGKLHMGHAAMLAVEDILVRFERMRGKKTLWLPGTDHAAIATQSKVEKELQKKEKKNRHELGREEFLRRVDKFARESHDTIVEQIRRMGSSVDWSREAFTLDERRQRAVMTAFKRMYDEGLIYRGYRVVNWDPKGQTTISDDEIVYQERDAILYTFRYSKEFPIPIATTRPETKVGDTAVAVHPDDPRYQEYIGKRYEVMFCGVPLRITVIADREVDPEFGTGAVGVTPAHSMTDFKMAQRHNLPLVQVINEYAKMMVDTPELNGKKVGEARQIIVQWITDNGLLEKEPERIAQNVATAERTGGIIEPLPKLQWFIDVNKKFILKHSELPGINSGELVTLKQLMKHAVEGGLIKIMPQRFEKTYFHWIENLDDWCISRQIWYGHRIPVWYRGEEVYCDVNPPADDGAGSWERDPDTLDTWFSSGLWTFSTLGWPDDTDDLRTYHPTDVLETGYDILFFWVARMILMSTYHLGQIPFKYVYLHGLVRDAKGRKMSKSLGNAMDPIDMIEKYGADATRMSLIIGAAAGNDINLSEDKIRAYKKFANKIWNASRFVAEHTHDYPANAKPDLTDADRKRLRELDMLAQDVTADIESFRLHLAAEKLYHYFWHTFADIVIEECKPRLSGGDASERRRTQHLLRTMLDTQLRLLHPFMPFVTEEIWSILHENENETLVIAPWPTQ